MGRSVYVLPRARDKPISDQLRRLRDEFGHCSLKLDGPFADSYDSVAKIVEHVQRRMRSEGMDEVSATVLTLLPQNLVPGDSLLSGSSMLDVPFILDMQPGMVRGYPESAGEAALVPSIGFQGGLAREIDPSSITILAVSMLRRLGRECYFSIYNCESSATDETHDIDMNVPAILLPEDRGMNMASVVPMPIVSKTSYPPFLEVVDEDALLSVIKLNNAYQHAHALMADMAGHGIKSYGERTSRSVRIGHELHAGISAWTVSEAKEDIEDAAGMFGPGNRLSSIRESVEQCIVRIMTTAPLHAMAAASAMLPKEIVGEIEMFVGSQSKKVDFFQFLDSLSDHPSIAQFKEYFRSTFTMNEHIHPVAECRSIRGDN